MPRIRLAPAPGKVPDGDTIDAAVWLAEADPDGEPVEAATPDDLAAREATARQWARVEAHLQEFDRLPFAVREGHRRSSYAQMRTRGDYRRAVADARAREHLSHVVARQCAGMSRSGRSWRSRATARRAGATRAGPSASDGEPEPPVVPGRSRCLDFGGGR
jgi:hypothetical protein